MDPLLGKARGTTYRTTQEVVSTGCFQAQYVVGVALCWAINFGFEWGTLTKFGKESLEDIALTKANSANTEITFDFLLTAFLVGFFTVSLSTGGIKVPALCRFLRARRYPRVGCDDFACVRLGLRVPAVHCPPPVATSRPCGRHRFVLAPY